MMGRGMSGGSAMLCKSLLPMALLCAVWDINSRLTLTHTPFPPAIDAELSQLSRVLLDGQ